MGMMRQISANARIFADASSSLPGIIASGDAAAATTIDFYARAEVQAVGAVRMGYVEPVGATSLSPDPIARCAAPHRELAIRFIEFVLSEAGQRLWNTLPARLADQSCHRCGDCRSRRRRIAICAIHRSG